MLRNNPKILGFLTALVISFIISLNYLLTYGIKIYLAGRYNEDLFSGLPFIIEKSSNGLSSFFSDWNILFSEPLYIGDSNFYYYVHLILYLIIKNITISYKVYAVIILAVSFFSMYILTYSLADNDKRLSALIAAIFYALTPYFLFELIGHQYMMWGYALLPISYYSIYRALSDEEKRRYKWMCIAGFFIALSTLYPAIQYVYINGIFLALFSFMLCFKSVSKIQFREALDKIIRIIAMFSIAFMLSAYFIFPTFFSLRPYQIPFTFSRKLTSSLYSNTFIEAIFLLNKGLSTDIKLNYFGVYGMLMVAFMLPVILSSILIILKKKKNVYLIFFLLGILAILFSIGYNAPPFLRLFKYAQEALPYFYFIRTPCRFSLHIALSFSLLGGISLGNITSKSYKISLNKYYKIKPLYLLFLSVSALYIFPAYIVAYSIAGPFETQPISSTTSKVVKWLGEHDPNQDYRIIDLTTLQVVAYHRSLERVGADFVLKYHCSPSFAKVLGLLNVKYIITEPDQGRPVLYWWSSINDVLSSHPDFDKVKIGSITIYINKLAKPRIYMGYGALTLGGPNSLSTFYSLFNSDFILFGTDFLNNEDNYNQLDKFKLLAFHDSDIMDLAFLRIPQRFKFEAWKYLNKDWRIVEDHYGFVPSARSYQNSVFGQLVISERAIYTDKSTMLTIPFSINDVGSYDVWIRARNDVPIDWSRGSNTFNTFPAKNNVISVSIDELRIGDANFGEVGGFKWIKVNDKTLTLSKGTHSLILLTNGNPIYIDMVAVIPAGLIDLEIKNSIAHISNLYHVYLLEFSNYFAGENAIRQGDIVPYTSDARVGYLTLKPNSIVSQRLFIAKSGEYVLGLRLLQRPDGGILNLKIDNATILTTLIHDNNNKWTWINTSTIFLNAGEHIIEVSNNYGYNSLDLAYLMEEPLVSCLIFKPSFKPNVQYNEVKLNTWRGNLSLSEPAFLVLTESYYPEWPFLLQTRNHEVSIRSSQAFYFLNAYYINSTGDVQFTVFHETSQVRKFSYAITLSTFIVCVVIIITESVLKKDKKVSLTQD